MPSHIQESLRISLSIDVNQAGLSDDFTIGSIAEKRIVKTKRLERARSLRVYIHPASNSFSRAASPVDRGRIEVVSRGCQYMSWITVIDENQAEGELKHVYGEIMGARGKLSNIMRVQSLNPASMRAHIELYVTLMFKRSSLSRADCEMLATVVSSLNECDYCIRHHAEALQFYWKDRDRVDRLVRDYRTADLTEEQHSMAEYARKLTSKPSSITEPDIDELRKMGYSDRQILDANLIVSYFNFVNRISEGLGVEAGDEEVAGYKY